MKVKRSERKDQIIGILRRRRGTRTRQRHLAEELKVSQQAISAVLRDMMEEGRVMRTRQMGYHEAPHEQV